MALVEQALVGDLPQRPPDRLDVGRVERAVGVVEVEPEADPLRQRVPVLEELEDRLAALRVELGDAVGLDLGLRLDPELLLDGDLDRQAVAVPAALALDVEAAHRLEARVDVLEDAREDVVRAGPAVGRRRALVEDPRRRALAPAQRLAEDVALAPALEHLLLELGEGLVGVDGSARHLGRAIVGAPRRGPAQGRRARQPAQPAARRAGRPATGRSCGFDGDLLVEDLVVEDDRDDRRRRPARARGRTSRRPGPGAVRRRRRRGAGARTSAASRTASRPSDGPAGSSRPRRAARSACSDVNAAHSRSMSSRRTGSSTAAAAVAHGRQQRQRRRLGLRPARSAATVSRRRAPRRARPGARRAAARPASSRAARRSRRRARRGRLRLGRAHAASLRHNSASERFSSSSRTANARSHPRGVLGEEPVDDRLARPA